MTTSKSSERSSPKDTETGTLQRQQSRPSSETHEQTATTNTIDEADKRAGQDELKKSFEEAQEPSSAPEPDLLVEKTDPSAREQGGLPSDGQGTVTGMKLVLITTAIMSSMFLVALDRTIIGTAIPRITNEFDSINDISWYASAYLITSCATQLLWGRIFTFYPTKTFLLVAIIIFEAGSALCGAAPSSIALIIGRAIGGLGAAGIFAGATVVVAEIVPLPKRPIYIGILGSVFGISSIVGPLLGGSFTDHVSWRWCFYINLPIGAVTIVILLFLLKETKKDHEAATLTRQIIRLDPAGTLVFLPATVCILLALQWGGVTHPWGSGRIIALFVVAGLLFSAFIAIQVWRQEDATMPPRIIMQRSVLFGAIYAIFIGGGMIVMTVYLPLWFQAIKGTSATQSGIDIIPLVLALVVGSILSGIITSKTGYYMPWLYVAVVLTAVAAGLMTTFKVDTSQPTWIGYQVLYGLGLGAGMQKSSLAAQAVLDQKDVPIGVALMFFAMSFGGSIIVCIAQSLFVNDLSDKLPRISNIDVSAILSGGATDLVKLVSPDKISEVLEQYNDSLTRTFFLVVVISCIMLLPCLGMEWKNIKKEESKQESPTDG